MTLKKSDAYSKEEFSNQPKTLIQFLFKDRLTTEQAKEIIRLTEVRTYQPDEVILTEGCPNTHLFFLIDGKIKVIHQGEEIAILSETGQILGELSLITGRSCQATGIALTATTLIVIDLEKTESLSRELQDLFKNSLNQLFSLILAEKLAATNEKARLFELTNRELKRTQKALQSASEDRIIDLSRNQRKILKTLDQLVSTELKDIENQLHSLVQIDSETISPRVTDQLNSLSKKVKNLITTIEPFSALFQKNHSLHGKRLLMAEEDMNEQINAWISLGGTGVEVTMASDLESGRQALSEGSFDIICVSEALIDLIIDSKSSSSAKAHYIYMTSKKLSESIQTLQEYPQISTLLARNPEDRLFTVKNMGITVQKLLTGDIFGAEKYLNWGVEFREYRITDSTQREELIEQMTQYFDSLGIKSTLKKKYHIIAEELLMNAIYDAPIDQNAIPRYNHLSRTIPVHLTPEEQGIFRYGFDGNWIAISVEDPFGALERSTVLEYLTRCFTVGISIEPIEGKGGGGNGLYQLIQASSAVIFNVQSGVKTEVIALLNADPLGTKIKKMPSFYFFEQTT